MLTQIGYANIWPLFGSANQLLSALVLITLCVFLKVTGRSNKMLFPPLIIMLCVTFTALVQRLLAMVKAIPVSYTHLDVYKRQLYPCGEGAGYAGGIMSAAVDGILTAEAILNE